MLRERKNTKDILAAAMLGAFLVVTLMILASPADAQQEGGKEYNISLPGGGEFADDDAGRLAAVSAGEMPGFAGGAVKLEDPPKGPTPQKKSELRRAEPRPREGEQAGGAAAESRANALEGDRARGAAR